MTGKLYICPTPIGNLEDMTIRTLNTLKSVDLILAEDTRHTLRLLNHFEIKKPLTSYHEHNKEEKESYIMDKLFEGQNLALVSDAGMPGISDPGEDLIKACIKNGVEVIGLPGPSASILALVLSGLETSKFAFEGFLNAKKSERIKALEKLTSEERTIILYESPHRILKLLKDILEVMGNRRISLARELTKKYEEINRGTVEELIEIYEARDIKGEFVVVLEGNKEKPHQIEFDIDLGEHIKLCMESGLSKKEAIKKVARERGMRKNEVYRASIDIEEI